MPTSIHAAGPTGQRSPGLDAAIAAWHAENPDTGGSSSLTADDNPEAPAEGSSASYLVTSAVTWPANLVWSTDPDGGTAPTITGTALVSLFTLDGVTRAVMGATFPAAVIPDPEDTTVPTAGTLAGSAITDTGFTLTVSGASDETALHATPYAFSTDNGSTYSAWQTSNVYASSGLDPETTYDCVHIVRDAALNIATGTAIEVTTEPASSGSAYNAAVLADSPALYYPLGDSSSPAVDATGNTTATSSAWPTFGVAGIGDGTTAADFDGTDDFISVTKPASLQTISAITVEALVNLDNLAADRTVLDNDGNGGLSERGFIFKVLANGRLSVTRVLGSAVSATGPSSPLVVAGVTAHVAFTYDGANLRLYINGAQTGADVACTGPISDALVVYPYTIGRTGRTLSSVFTPGVAAGIAVYPTALTAARLLAHATAAGL